MDFFSPKNMNYVWMLCRIGCKWVAELRKLSRMNKGIVKRSGKLTRHTNDAFNLILRALFYVPKFSRFSRRKTLALPMVFVGYFFVARLTIYEVYEYVIVHRKRNTASFPSPFYFPLFTTNIFLKRPFQVYFCASWDAFKPLRPCRKPSQFMRNSQTKNRAWRGPILPCPSPHWLYINGL